MWNSCLRVIKISNLKINVLTVGIRQDLLRFSADGRIAVDFVCEIKLISFLQIYSKPLSVAVYITFSPTFLYQMYLINDYFVLFSVFYIGASPFYCVNAIDAFSSEGDNKTVDIADNVSCDVGPLIDCACI